VGAIVRLRPDWAVDLDVLARHAAARLAAHKTPVVLRLREAPFPRNAAGKVLKRDLREELLSAGDG